MSLGFQALYMAHEYPAVLNYIASHSQGHAQCTGTASAEQVQYVEPQEDHTFLWPLSP
jgi:hypothetical protein